VAGIRRWVSCQQQTHRLQGGLLILPISGPLDRRQWGG